MKKFFFFLSCACSFVFAQTNVINPLKFVVVVTSYNNISYYEKNLSSIFSQDYSDFRLIYIDDASIDGTYEAVRDWIAAHGKKDQTTIVHRDKNCGGLKNIYDACHSCKKEEIICLLDGDDWFANNQVLSILADHYKEDAWVTYGQFMHFPSGKLGLCSSFDLEELQEQRMRQLPWRTSHLKTFYAGLFQKIKKEDLLFSGYFFESATDLAIMFPLLEMATVHARFIPDVLYIYNNQNPLSHHQIRHEKQRFFRDVIRSKAVYPKLEKKDFI